MLFGQVGAWRAEACGDARAVMVCSVRQTMAVGTTVPVGRPVGDPGLQDAAGVEDEPPEGFDGAAGTELFEPERESVR